MTEFVPSVAQHRAESTARGPLRCDHDQRYPDVGNRRRRPADCRLLEAAGQRVARRDGTRRPGDGGLLAEIRQQTDIDAVLLTGGTGMKAARDQTYETVAGLLSKTLPGYGELFRMLSFEQVGAAAMLSRATGGLMDQKVLLTMPGSPAAVRLAMERLDRPRPRPPRPRSPPLRGKCRMPNDE